MKPKVTGCSRITSAERFGLWGSVGPVPVFSHNVGRLSVTVVGCLLDVRARIQGFVMVILSGYSGLVPRVAFVG